ncbi:MAG TPA: peptidoglycan-associated lipoprotein Pal [Candidatus Solibacter sp.]|nr:peptidoglycan-associated lipoprotein Pal [Candidatus Solibacter sp.]
MIRVSRFVYRGAFFTSILALALVAGCHKTPPAPPPAPPAPAPPPAKPTVSLTASPTSINKGDSATLSWTSTDATTLTISPEVGAVTAQGSTKVSPSDSTTYTITASGPGGSADSSARITVEAPPPPPPPPAAGPTIEELFLRDVKDAYFDFNKADIRPDAREALGATADFLKAHPEVKVTVEGHCDERGSTEYNLVLGDRRAAAVKAYLVSLGISADRMNTVSYGKEKPFCTESNEECWQSNRRGHFVMAK